MRGYVCMYCQHGRDSEYDDRACNCCFGEPAEATLGLTVICSLDYQTAKRFADRRRWARHSWVYGEERRLYGVEPHRVVYLDGFWGRPDAVLVEALVRQRLARTAQQDLVDAGRDAADLLTALRRRLGDAG